MVKLIYTLFFALLLPLQVLAQTGPARSALKQITKENYEKAERIISKRLAKDSINPELKFVGAKLLFNPKYEWFNIDSAYTWVNWSLEDMDSIDEKRLKKMNKLPLNESIIFQLRGQIDSAAFVSAKTIHTEVGYIYFIQNFQFAVQIDSAILLRNEVAFNTASAINTYASYKAFMDKYPDAIQVRLAQDRYEELLFLEKTKDRKLSSFETFLSENPGTPFRDVIVKNIFEISTAAAEEKSYLNFIERFNETKEAKKARDVLYHLRKEYELTPDVLNGIANDSLKIVASIDGQALFPFIWQGKYGFMNEKAEELIAPVFTEIDERYLCENIEEDYLIQDRRIVGRNGNTIYTGAFDDVEDLGFGFLLIQNRNCSFVLHKSGFSIGDGCIEDAAVIAGAFIALKKRNWALYSFAGEQLSEFEYKDIQSMEDFIILHFHNNRTGVYAANQIAGLANGEVLPAIHIFDEVKSWSDGLIWIREADREGLIDTQFRFVVPLAKQKISNSRSGLLSITNEGTQFLSHEQLKDTLYSEVVNGSNWMALKKSGSWQFWSHTLNEMVPGDFDSVSIMATVPLGHRNDSSFVITANGKIWYMNPQLNIRFAGSISDTYFMLMDERNRTYLIDEMGKRLFRLEYEKVEPIAPGIFLVEQRGKKGLVTAEGKAILKPEYDAFALSKHDAISTLKDKKFGLYAPWLQATIPPVYERNLQFYTPEILVAYQQGFYAFIDWSNKPLSGFEFEAFEYWNDSVAIVKQHFQWKLFDLKERTFIMSGIKSYKLIRNDDEEKIAIINQDNSYGVISNLRGIIIPPTFSDIVNIGSDKQPFYFTEKHVEEAAYFVVVYYNGNGEVVKRQAFEAEEYDKIYCVKK